MLPVDSVQLLKVIIWVIAVVHRLYINGASNTSQSSISSHEGHFSRRDPHHNPSSSGFPTVSDRASPKSEIRYAFF